MCEAPVPLLGIWLDTSSLYGAVLALFPTQAAVTQFTTACQAHGLTWPDAQATVARQHGAVVVQVPQWPVWKEAG